MLRPLLLTTAIAAVTAAPAAASPLPLSSVHILGASAGDRAGTSVASAGDVNGDGHDDLIIGAPGANPTANGGSGGAAYIVYGPFTPGQTIALGALGTGGVRLDGSGAKGGEMAGVSVSGAGDVNDDGLADVIVGGPGATPGQEAPQTRAGRAYIVFGSRTLHSMALSKLGAGGILLQGASHQFPDAFGWHVTPLGDVDGDGHADVGVAAPGNSGFEEAYTRGRAYVVFGRSTPGTITMARPGSSAFRIGMAVPGQLTAITNAGDWNGDGRNDIAVADGHAIHGRGGIFVVYGKPRTTPVDLARLGKDGVTISGGNLHYRLAGATLAGGSDVDGDGRPDLIVGESAAYPSAFGPAAGAAWLIRGSRTNAPVDLRNPGTRAWQLTRGERGWTVGADTAIGHVGGDKRADAVLLANGGPAVIYGSRNRSTLALPTLAPDRGFLADVSDEPVAPGILSTPVAGHGGYTSIADAGDLNGDGHDDILAGAPLSSDSAAQAGLATLFFVP